MKDINRNPVIRVYPHTRKKLKILAAERGETMQDTVERLVQEELEREEAKGKARSQVTQLAQED
jgi:macrodomain Ter protein organizer (MatP/YcbG family)